MKMNQALVLAGIVSFCSASGLLAQDNASPQGRPGRGGPPTDAQRQEYQQRRMDDYKKQLEITDDSEWNAIQPLIQKVSDAQRAAFADRIRGAFGGRNR